MKFSIDLPVQFRDFDIMGHVNNATYLQYMETGRVEFARSIGQIGRGVRTGFIVASARCEFKRPIIDERRITVSVWVSRIGRRSWDLDYEITGTNSVVFAIGRTTQVGFDYTTRTTAQLSRKLNKDLEKHMASPLKFREAS